MHACVIKDSYATRIVHQCHLIIIDFEQKINLESMLLTHFTTAIVCYRISELLMSYEHKIMIKMPKCLIREIGAQATDVHHLLSCVIDLSRLKCHSHNLSRRDSKIFFIFSHLSSHLPFPILYQYFYDRVSISMQQSSSSTYIQQNEFAH